MQCIASKRDGTPCSYKARPESNTCKIHEGFTPKEIKQAPVVAELTREEVLVRISKYTGSNRFLMSLRGYLNERGFLSQRQLQAAMATFLDVPRQDTIHTIKCATWGCENLVTGTALQIGRDFHNKCEVCR